MIVAGHGPPLLLIPGIQGRWEWTRPTVAALAAHYRVAAYSLAGDPEDVPPFEATCLDDLARQALNVMTRAGMRRAVVCGVSYGGLIAARLAARHPDRVSALVLASAIPPDFQPDARTQRCVAHPWLMAPAFLAGAPGRAIPEIRNARPTDWLRCGLHMGAAALLAPQSPRRMARRLRLLDGEDLWDDCRRIAAPTLVLTGEEGLDRVVPPALSRRFLTAIRHARIECLEGTGHFGLVTRPDEFTARIRWFVEQSQGAPAAVPREAGASGSALAETRHPADHQASHDSRIRPPARADHETFTHHA